MADPVTTPAAGAAGATSQGAPPPAPAPTPSSTPAPSTPPPSTTPAAAAGPSGASPGGSLLAGGAAASGAAGGGQAAADQYVGILDALRELGMDTSGFPSDRAALQNLALAYQQLQRSQHLIQAGQQYYQVAPQFQQWLVAQQQAAQQQQQQQKGWWNPPPFDPAWRAKLIRDPQTGEIKPSPGTAPDLVSKYLAAAEHQQNFLDKFAFDPIGAIKPGIEEVARAVAQELIQQHLGGYQEQTQAQQFVKQHADWLFAKDAQGHVARDPFGNQVLTNEGRLFQQYVAEAEQIGLRGVDAQQKYAMACLQRDLAFARLNAAGQQTGGAQPPPQQPAATGDLLKQQFLQQAAHRPNAGGSTTPPANPNQPPPSPFAGRRPSARDLQARMLEQMGANGFGAKQTIDLTR